MRDIKGDNRLGKSELLPFGCHFRNLDVDKTSETKVRGGSSYSDSDLQQPTLMSPSEDMV